MATQPHQPNFQRLSEAFVTASNETAKIQNIPAVEQGTTLLDAIRALQTQSTQLQTTVNTLAVDLATVKTDLATVKTDLATVKTDLATVKTDLRRESVLF